MISTRNVALSAAALAAVAQALTVNTPASAVQCQPLALGWGEGTAPYYVSIIPGGQPSAAALESFAQQSGTSYTWMVDISAGTAITVKVVDSTGDTNYSDQVTIQAGTTTDCSSSSSSGSSASSGSGLSGGSSAAAAGGSSASSAAGSTASSASTRASGGLASGRSTASTTTSNSATAGAGANAAATTSADKDGSAMTGAKAGLGLLVSGLIFALAA